MVELKAKVPHDFWTKFVDSDRSGGAAEGPFACQLQVVHAGIKLSNSGFMYGFSKVLQLK